MKKICICLLLVWGILPAFGQGNSDPSLRVSTSSPAPESSIDLLQKSLRSSNTQVIGTANFGKNATDEDSTQNSNKETAESTSKPSDPASGNKPAPTEVPSTSSADKGVVPTPVQSTLPDPKDQPAPAPKAVPAAKSSSTTLDMPLPVGGNAQSVQTSVEPVKQQPAPKRKPNPVKKAQPAPAKTSDSKPASMPTPTEQAIETNNALLPGNPPQENPAPGLQDEEDSADAELEYAIKMMQQSKEKAQAVERPLPPPASQNRPSKVPVANRKFNPNAFRPGVEWIASKSSHFDIYTQKRTSGVPSSNMAMNFEASYQTLRRFIPWMMSGRVRVFVYQDHDSYLRYEPDAKAWTRAVAYPTRGEIVIYDEPGKVNELKEVFTHELTHIFTQQFFDSHKTGRIMTPLWLDEGLAVFMEDQHNGKEGVWTHDFKTLNFQRDPETRPAFTSPSMFGSSKGKKLTNSKQEKPVYFTSFDKFMDENSLQNAETSGRLQEWYFQAYTMVRFLLNPAGGNSPSNRMQFEQFTRLIAQGEAVRNPSTGFLMKDARGKTMYEPYSTEKALGRAYRFNTIETFENAFWRWVNH